MSAESKAAPIGSMYRARDGTSNASHHETSLTVIPDTQIAVVPRTRLTVIPAKAGIQSNVGAQHTSFSSKNAKGAGFQISLE
ncbi:hypothetical protein EKH79_08890 [Dyella dinghuensis]|uniref:Uncharacterized protein n=1 Tax=Dyella dinghuensis TaxID=1920169 RepID=A0A432LT69_9GAMM|nr:hypothetical protein [Dyella dinghuensis]RUL64161.1 hypothetical protein EKH79_08890 [Dyella dinghuensis]